MRGPPVVCNNKIFLYPNVCHVQAAYKFVQLTVNFKRWGAYYKFAHGCYDKMFGLLPNYFQKCNTMISIKYYYLTTILVGLGFLWDFVLLKLRTCSLYHEKLCIQKFNDMITRFLNYYFQPLTSGSCQRLFLFLWCEGCMIQESYC